MKDKEILDFKVGDETIRDMSTITFFQWIAKKIDGTSSTSGAATELRLAISSPMLAGRLEDSERIRLVNKLLLLNISL